MRGSAYPVIYNYGLHLGNSPIFRKGDDVDFFDRFITGIWI
jgi:hypothetical protein